MIALAYAGAMPAALSEHERQISRRFREFRIRARATQARFAEEAGISRDLLAAYEAGRAALPWNVCARIGARNHLNFAWLYSGEGEPEGSIELAEMIHSAPDKARFSREWEKVRAHATTAVWLWAIEGKLATAKGAVDDLRRLLRDADALPKDERAQLAADPRWQEASARAAEIAMALVMKKETGNSHLTLSPIGDIPSDVHNTERKLRALLARVKRGTAERGQKSALAKKLRVPRQNITAWLKGRRLPDANSTLRLLELFPES